MKKITDFVKSLNPEEFKFLQEHVHQLEEQSARLYAEAIYSSLSNHAKEKYYHSQKACGTARTTHEFYQELMWHYSDLTLRISREVVALIALNYKSL